MNGPMANFLSAPLWLITTLHIVTLTLHFVAMNFVFGGILTLMIAKIKDKWDDPVVRRITRIMPAAMAATVTLGVAPLLFVQLTYYAEIYSAAIVSGWFWLGIVFAVIAVYYLIYGTTISKHPAKRATLFYGLALIGLVYVSFTYSSVFAFGENPAVIKAVYAENQSGLLFNPRIGDYILRWLHMLTGALAVGGFCIGVIARDSEPMFNTAKTVYLWGAVGAMIMGLGYLFTLIEIMPEYMRSLGVWTILIAIVLTAASLHYFFKRRFWWAGILLFISMVSMVYNRHVVRVLELAGRSDPSTMPTRPQWSIFIVFLLCFLLAIGLVAYMLRLFFRKQEAAA